jgi:mannose-1-phosphate guanylyltransferase
MRPRSSGTTSRRRATLQALILAGGSGTRFWPLSRRHRPKQLLALEGQSSLLQQSRARLDGLVDPADTWVCTTRRLEAAVREQLPEVPVSQVLAEPEGRNTAAAIGWAVRSMPEAVRGQAVAVLPADHRIADPAAFGGGLQVARRAAEERDRVLALGVEPEWAETGYGYLEVGAPLADSPGLRSVVRFTEKPDQATAERFLASGRYLWNAGIFVFRGTTLLKLLGRYLPTLAEGLETIASSPGRLDDVYRRLPAISIDHGLMEQLEDLATVPLACGWSDLGSWGALAELLPADDAGTVRRGDVVAVGADSCLLWAEEGTVAAVGVQGLVVVRTADAVLVVPRERSQEVREVVARLREAGRTELL